MNAPCHKLYLPDEDARKARIAELDAQGLEHREAIGRLREERRKLEPDVVETEELEAVGAFRKRLNDFLRAEFDRLEPEIGDIEAGTAILTSVAEETAELAKGLGADFEFVLDHMRETHAEAPGVEELAGLPPEGVRH